MRGISIILTGAVATIAITGAAQAQIIMKASHQFPGGKGDVRDDMVQLIAKEVKADNVGIDIQVYPGASLFKPNDQWNAMVNGQLDITLFPLDYASGKVRTFSATLMPGLIRSQDRAKRINNSQFMIDAAGRELRVLDAAERDDGGERDDRQPTRQAIDEPRREERDGRAPGRRSG